ncbi:MAG: DUF1802 family protein [Verrucomicrobia bacterium]|nr:DUF1802 family protein [Verrucomicrobiota bacterium]MBV9657982.1 DUF1802 family protein [Verrucomicrobiota bacterium]
MTTTAPITTSTQATHHTSWETVAFAFKDWALACEALGSGRQSVILRKGGLAEGRGGFVFQHERFFLFPTRYHEQAEKIRAEELAALTATAADAGAAADDLVTVRYAFHLEWSRRVENWETAARLAPWHVYREEVVRERFAYADRQHQAGMLTVGFGRAYRLEPVWRLADRPAFGGCKSWITLPADERPPGLRFTPVLGDAEHAARAAQLERLLAHSEA